MKTMFHYVYWSLVFTPGLMDLLEWHDGIYRIGFPLIGIVLFLGKLTQSSYTVKVPLLLPVFAFVAVAAVSSIYNEQALFNWAFFLIFSLLSSYLYFVVIINEVDDQLVRRVSRFVAALVLLQIPAVLIKFWALGQTESGAIGTISVRGGSISTVFPLLVVAFLSSFYFYKRRFIYLVLIIMFALFGIIGGKRAIVLLIPLEVILTFVLYVVSNKVRLSRGDIQKAVTVIVVSGFIAAITIKTNPTLNPEGSYWGSIDLEYVLEYSESYTDSGYFEEGATVNLQEIRRVEGLHYFVNRIMGYELPNMILGDGAGRLVQSRYSESSGEMIDVYGVRYGGRMGFVWVLMQVGLLGMSLYLIIHVLLLWKVVKVRRLGDTYHQALRLGVIVASVFMFMDFMIYSVSSIQTEAIKGTYFFAVALLWRQAYASKRNVYVFPQVSAGNGGVVKSGI